MKYYSIPLRGENSVDESDNFFKPLWSMSTVRLMRTDIVEKENSYLIEMEIPGCKKEDLDISIENGYLSVSAKICDESEAKDEKRNYIRRERKCGSCSRSFYLGEITEEGITASYNNGILEINIPKEEKKPQRKQIDIK